VSAEASSAPEASFAFIWKFCTVFTSCAVLNTVRTDTSLERDTRHQAITELAEMGASIATIEALGRHMSPEMVRHCSHVRMHAKREVQSTSQTAGLRIGRFVCG